MDDSSCYCSRLDYSDTQKGLASLHALPPYLDDIIMLHSKHDKTSPSPSTPVAALKTIINNLNDPSNGGRRFWNPAALKSMSSWQQQDAQEYFSKILDEVEKDGSKAFRSALETSGFDKLSAQQPLTTVDPSQHPRNPLEGLLAQRVGCMRCGWSEGLALIPFICLTVPLGRGWDHELVDCLDEYTKLEHIEGVECTRCTMLERKRQLARLLGEASKVESGTPGEPKGISRLPEQLRTSAMERFDVVQSALEDDDFSESTMTGKCKISPKDRVTVTKSCQAVIARAPKALVVHINRSIFDEFSGVQKKNHANVRFPQILDLAPWCLGSTVAEKEDKGEGTEEWVTDPGRSMLPGGSTISPHAGPQYEIRALITHYGRHENGHYICYRQSPESKLPHGSNSDDGAKEPLISTPWWRISDDDVMMVSQETVLEQGNVFMLFYERVDRATPDDYDSRPLTSRNDPLTTVESAKDGDETARLDDKAETTLDVPAIAAIKDDTSGVEQDATLDIHSQDVPEPAKATTSEGESEHINEPTAIGGSHDHIIMEKDTEKDETDSRSTHTTGLDPRLVAAPPMWTAGPDGGEERGQEERLSSSVVMAN